MRQIGFASSDRFRAAWSKSVPGLHMIVAGFQWKVKGDSTHWENGPAKMFLLTGPEETDVLFTYAPKIETIYIDIWVVKMYCVATFSPSCKI